MIATATVVTEVVAGPSVRFFYLPTSASVGDQISFSASAANLDTSATYTMVVSVNNGNIGLSASCSAGYSINLPISAGSFQIQPIRDAPRMRGARRCGNDHPAIKRHRCPFGVAAGGGGVSMPELAATPKWTVRKASAKSDSGVNHHDQKLAPTIREPMPVGW